MLASRSPAWFALLLAGVNQGKPRTILVTAFGSFPNVRVNPSALVLRHLARHAPRFERLGIDLRCEVLTVRFDSIEAELAEAVRRHRPDAILHLGVASRRRRVSVETRALNRAGPVHPDAAGLTPSQILVPGGPSELRATYPAARILAALRAQGLAAERSIDAGDYVCNTTLYRSLARAEALSIGFIHIPKLSKGASPAGRAPPRPTATAIVEAVIAVLLILARSVGARRS